MHIYRSCNAKAPGRPDGLDRRQMRNHPTGYLGGPGRSIAKERWPEAPKTSSCRRGTGRLAVPPTPTNEPIGKMAIGEMECDRGKSNLSGPVDSNPRIRNQPPASSLRTAHRVAESPQWPSADPRLPSPRWSTGRPFPRQWGQNVGIIAPNVFECIGQDRKPPWITFSRSQDALVVSGGIALANWVGNSFCHPISDPWV